MKICYAKVSTTARNCGIQDLHKCIKTEKY